MKKLISIVFLFMSLAGIAQTPVKISALPPITGNGLGGYLPIAKAGVTYKILVDSMGVKTYVDSPIIATLLGDTAILLKLDTNQAHQNAMVNQYQLSQVGGGSPVRFGIEDATSTVDRAVDMQNHSFVLGNLYSLDMVGGDFSYAGKTSEIYQDKDMIALYSQDTTTTSEYLFSRLVISYQGSTVSNRNNVQNFTDKALGNYYIPLVVKINGTDHVANDSGKIDLGTISGGGSTDTTSLSNRINANTTAIAGKQAAFTEVSGEEATGATTSTITLAHAPLTGTFKFYKNGVRLPAAEFSRSGVTVTLTSARLSADLFQSDYKY